MKKRIITVVGKDSIGITAKVCVYLAENSVNILDIAQTIVGGYFNMMMVVDIQESSKSTEIIANELKEIGDEIGVQIKVQHEKIFETMHRNRRKEVTL